MVLVNFDTGEPLVPGDLVHDDSKPTEEHVLQIFEVYKSHFEQFHGQCEEEDEYYYGTRSVPFLTKCLLILLDLRPHTL